MDIPSMEALKVAYAFGSDNNMQRYQRWFSEHRQTKTMLQTIMADQAPNSSAIEGGITAYTDGEMTIFEFEDFLNHLVSAYVGKMVFLEKSQASGLIKDKEFEDLSSSVTRQIEALVGNAETILLKDGAVLTFNPANRLQVSLVEGDDQEVIPDTQVLEDFAPVESSDGATSACSLTLPHEVRIQAAYPMLVEKELLNFSRMYYSHGSSKGILRIIASINGEALSIAERAFLDLSNLHITVTDFLDVLIAKNITYAAQLKFFRHLLVRKEITQEDFNEYAKTAVEYQKVILGQASKNLRSLNVELFFGENAKLSIKAVGGTT